jgi:putative flippase GtrA
MKRVLEIYDHCIWKELDKTDAVSAEVSCIVNFIANNSFSFSSFLQLKIPTSSANRYI